MKTKLFIFTLTLLVITQTHAQESEFDKDIAKFLEVNGSKQSLAPVADQIINQFKMMKSSVPESFWIELKAELVTDLSALSQKLAPVYKKNFTHDEIKGLIVFFESPLGKTFTTKSAALVPETMQVSQQWGMEIAQKIQQKLVDRGY